jgi:hypothetical protein
MNKHSRGIQPNRHRIEQTNETQETNERTNTPPPPPPLHSDLMRDAAPSVAGRTADSFSFSVRHSRRRRSVVVIVVIVGVVSTIR